MEKDKYDKPSFLDKVILNMLKKHEAKKRGKAKKIKTTRTKAIESQAKKNFGTDLSAELAKLRKKGQGK